MLGLVASVAGTIALSMISAYGFLRLRYRGIGPPFGPRARPWAIAIMVTTALASAGLGLAVAAASHHTRAAYAGIIVPGGLWLGKVSAGRSDHHASLLPLPLATWLTYPFNRLDNGIGEDLQDWCDARSRAVLKKPDWVSDAAQYYFNQVSGRLTSNQAREQLGRWRESIEHKIAIVRLVDLHTTPARLQTALQSHPSTRDMRAYSTADPVRLARRLVSEAQNELHLFLAFAYRLGFHKMLIYPFRAPAAVKRHGPGASAGAGPTVI